MKDKDGNKLSAGLAKQVVFKDKRVASVVSLSAFDEEKNLRIIIETPRGSRNKYDYDEETGMFQCHSTLPLGLTFPLDFGFIPSTLADDGDPLDVMVFMDEPCYPGVAARARLIGALEARQTETDGTQHRNDRLVAIQSNSLLYPDIQEVNELPQSILDQVEHFFVSLNKPKGKSFKEIKWCKTKHAYKLLDKAVQVYLKQNHKRSA
jgi:inorganic pyrophosphatase